MTKRVLVLRALDRRRLCGFSGLSVLLAVALVATPQCGNGQESRSSINRPKEPLPNSQQNVPLQKVDRNGDPLPDGAIARAGSNRLRLGTLLQRAEFSSDGKHVASWSKGGIFCLWNAKTGELVQRNEFPSSSVGAMRFIENGHGLAVLRMVDGQARIWDFTEEQDAAEPPANLGRREGPVQRADLPRNDPRRFSRFAISSDGKTLAGAAHSENESYEVSFLSIEPGKTFSDLKELRTIAPSKGYPYWLSFAANDTRLVEVRLETLRRANPRNDDGETYRATAALWNVETGELVRRFEVNSLLDNSFAVSGDAKFLAMGAADSVAVYDLETGAALHQLECFGFVHALAFSKSGQLLVSGGRDKVVRLWDPAKGKLRREFAGHFAPIEAASISPDERTVASGSQDGTVRLWDINTGKEIEGLPLRHNYHVMAMEYSRDGKLVVTGGWDGLVVGWDADTGEPKWQMQWDELMVNSLSLSSDDRLLAVGGSRGAGALRVVEVPSGRVVREFPNQQDVGFNSLAFSPDNSWVIASNSREAVARAWSIETGKSLFTLEHDEPELKCLAISSDGQTVATSAGSTQAASDVIRTWSTTSGKPLREFPSEKGGVDALAFLPGNKRLMSCGWSTLSGSNEKGDLSSPNCEDSVQLWDIGTESVVAKFPGQPYQANDLLRRVNDIAVSPDGKLIATAEHQGTVNFYDVQEKKLLATVTHGGELRCVKFSRDGRRLASAGTDTTALVWDVATVLNQKGADVK